MAYAPPCTFCAAKLKPGHAKCGACGAWNLGQSASDLPPLCTLAEFAAANMAGPMRDRIASGPWDLCFGTGGIVDSSVILLGGARGSGKSTFAIQWCAGILAARGGTIIYLGNEEHPAEVASRALRIGQRQAWESIKAVSSLDLQTHFRYLDALASGAISPSPTAVLIDSVSGLCGDDRDMAREVSGKLKKIAKGAHPCPVLSISHINKDESFHGAEFLQHDCDTLLALELQADTGLRYLHTLKNRFGPAHVEVCFAMTESAGLSPFSGKVGKTVYKEGIALPKEPKPSKPQRGEKA